MPAPSPILSDLLHLATHLCRAPIAILQLTGADVSPRTMTHGLDDIAAVEIDDWAPAFADLDATRAGETAADPSLARIRTVMGPPRIRAYAATPLRAGDKGWGTLLLLNPRPWRITAAEQDLLERVARQVVAHVESEVAARRRETSRVDAEWAHAAAVRERDVTEPDGVEGLDRRMRLIADRLRDERSRLASEQHFRRVVEGLKEVLFETDPVGRWSYLNPAWTEITGFCSQHCLGRPVSDFIHPDDVELHEKRFRPLLQRTSERARYEVRLRTCGEGWRWVEVHARPGEQGHASGTSGTLRDTTEQRQLSDALVRAGQEALAASRMKSEFLANMSHEIRTPINGVIGLTTLLLETALTGEQQDLCEGIQSSAEALLSIVNDVLDLSKVEAGKLAIEPVAFALRKTLQAALEPVAVKAQRKGLRLQVECDRAVPDAIISDPNRIRQVLVNLVDNAIKFTNRGAVTVAVAVAHSDTERPRLVFSVADQGIGIRSDKLDHIFEKFTQADSSTTRTYGGSGLGLAICRQLVALMEGKLSVNTQVGVGSTFSFELPLVEAAAPSGVPAAGGDAAGVASGVHVLVAEDNTINQKVARRFLERLGCVVEIVSNGEEALARVQARDYTAVFMDCQMPKMDGYEATRRIRALPNRRELPIIALTAHAMRGDRERCLEAGMSDYLSKPLQPEALAAALARLTVGSHAKEESPA